MSFAPERQHHPWLLSSSTKRSGQETLLTADRRLDHRPVPPALLPHSCCSQSLLARSSSSGPVVVYLLVNANGEDISVPQRLLAEHQPMVELLDWLVAPGSPVRVGQADQLSAPRMQLRRHLQWAASIYDTRALRQWQYGSRYFCSWCHWTHRAHCCRLIHTIYSLKYYNKFRSFFFSFFYSLFCLLSTLIFTPETITTFILIFEFNLFLFPFLLLFKVIVDLLSGCLLKVACTV